MRATIIHVALISGALAAGGCAKQEIVRKDEPIAPAAVAAKLAPKVENQKSIPEKKAPAISPAAQTDAGNLQKKEATGQKNKELAEALEKVYFDFDSSNLDDSARQTLVKNATFMKKNGSAKVRIEGNCDERGSDEYNLALGERRAKSAMKYLVTMGIPAARLSTISYGKEKPADPGHDEAAWTKNRRDDFVVQ